MVPDYAKILKIPTCVGIVLAGAVMHISIIGIRPFNLENIFIFQVLTSGNCEEELPKKPVGRLSAVS